MKYEFLVALFVLYQLSIYLYLRRWVNTREDRLTELVKEWKLHPAQHQHTTVMTHAPWRKKVVLFIAVVMIGLMFAMVLGVGASIEEFPWSSVSVAVAMILTLCWTPWGMVAEAYGIAMVMDEHAITRMSPWSKERTVMWGDIESVTYSWFWAWFTIRTAKHSIHVTTVIVGLERFAQEMVSQVPSSRIHVSKDIMGMALRGPFRYS